MKKYDKTITEILDSYLGKAPVNWQGLLSDVIPILIAPPGLFTSWNPVQAF